MIKKDTMILQIGNISLAPSDLGNERGPFKKERYVHLESHEVETTILISIKRVSSNNFLVP